MARKRSSDQSNDQPERWPGDEDERTSRPRDADDGADGFETEADQRTDRDERAADLDDVDREQDEDEAAAGTLPTASDLASRGFTPDEVQRLVVVSDRQAQSDESQLAEATLRRLRFTRWLIEHGMLDEWSA